MSKNEKTQKTIEAMKKQTIGVEVEMYNITREKAAKIAADLFGTNHYQDTAYRNGYSTWSAWDAQGREWKMQKDVSIKAYNDSQKCELVTPILTYDDIELLQDLIRRLRKAGAKSYGSHSCGVHIHIGADLGKEGGHTPQTLRNLANIMASKESLLRKATSFYDGRNNWVRISNPEFIERLNRTKPQTRQELEDCWYEGNGATFGRTQHYNASRYHMLNLHATFTKGTVEFRCFNFEEGDRTTGKKNGLHAGLLKSWIQLCLAMSQQAKDLKTASPKEPQRDNERFAMRTWMNRMGMIGEEFSTARKILIKNLDGNAAWRFGSAA